MNDRDYWLFAYAFICGSITRTATAGLSFLGYLFWYILLYLFFYFVYFVMDKLWHMEKKTEGKMKKKISKKGRGRPKKEKNQQESKEKIKYQTPKNYMFLWTLMIATAAIFFIWIMTSQVGHGRWECIEYDVVKTLNCPVIDENLGYELSQCSLNVEKICKTEAWVRHNKMNVP